MVGRNTISWQCIQYSVISQHRILRRREIGNKRKFSSITIVESYILKTLNLKFWLQITSNSSSFPLFDMYLNQPLCMSLTAISSLYLVVPLPSLFVSMIFFFFFVRRFSARMLSAFRSHWIRISTCLLLLHLFSVLCLKVLLHLFFHFFCIFYLSFVFMNLGNTTWV